MSSGQTIALFAVAIACGLIGGTIGKRKGRQDLGILLGFFLAIIGVIIIACMSKTEEARVQEAEARLRAEEEARRRLDAEKQWPYRNPWDNDSNQK